MPAGVIYSDISNSNLFVFQAPTLGGLFMFSGRVAGTGVTAANDDSIWSGTAASPTVLVREGGQAPGAPAGVTISLRPGVARNNSLQVATNALLSGSGVTTTNDESIYTSSNGSLQLLGREDDPAPGTAPGWAYGSFGTSVKINDAGQVYFSNAIRSGLQVDRAVYLGSPDNVQLVARDGDAAPGTPAGTRFLDVAAGPNSGYPLSGSGMIGFRATLTGTGVTSANNSGRWVGSPGGVQLLAREGDPAPGIAGAVYDTFEDPSTSFGLNSAGIVAFRAVLTGAKITPGNDAGIWSGQPGALNLLAREGDPAPEIAAGNVFAFLTPPSLSEAGQIVFRATLTGPDISTVNDTGIWYTDEQNLLRLLVRSGDSFDVDDTAAADIRTIETISAPTSPDSEDIDPLGRIALQLTFTDGTSGLFITTVPEPHAMLCFALLVSAIATQRGAL